MADLDLGKEIGPLPLGAWIAVIAGGLGIALWSRNSNTNPAEEYVVDDTGTPDGVGDGTVGGWEETSPDNNPDTPGITNNDEWGNQAINWLIAQGYDPAWAYSAISKALRGGRGDNKLSVREYALWKVALRKFGAPPYPVDVPPPGGLPPIQPPLPGIRRHRFVPNKPPNGKCRKCRRARGDKVHNVATQPNGNGNGRKFKYATVKPAPLPGSTLKSLAQIHYRDASKWNRIYEANRKGRRRADGSPGLIENPNRLRPGWKLIIPR